MAEITNRLTLENVLEDQFRSPLSLRDFRVYLTYEEYSVENLGMPTPLIALLPYIITDILTLVFFFLDFYEWYENYKKTFDSLNYSIKSLSSAPEKKYHSFDPTLVYVNPDGDPLPKLDQPPIYPSQYTELQPLQIPPIAHPATKSLRPTSIQNQPLRAEIDQILATYILPGSPNELNLTSGTRAYVTEQARLTTHPQAFQPAIVEVLDIMHAQSFVNFRHLIAETNLDKVHWFKVVFWLCGPLTLGLIIVLVLLLLDQSRWWRLCALPLIWLGLVCVCFG